MVHDLSGSGQFCCGLCLSLGWGVVGYFPSSQRVVVHWYVGWQRGFVGAGFMPAFKIKQKILSELERGHKARAYMHPVSGSRNRTADGANPFVGRVRDKQIFKFEELPHPGSLF